MTTKFACAAAMLALILGSAGQAAGCSYIAFPLAQVYAGAERAIIATVTADLGAEARAGTFDLRRWRVAVHRTLKGPPTVGETEVTSEQTTCGLELDPGETWLFIGRGAPLFSQVTDSSKMLVTADGRTMADNLAAAARLEAGGMPGLPTCLGAGLLVSRLLTALPRACGVDADCSAHYVDPEPCAAPVVARGDAIAGETERRLLALQAAARRACAPAWSGGPACAPIPSWPRCVERVGRDGGPGSG